MATSDLHMHVFPWDYGSARRADHLGLGRIAGLVAQARQEALSSLLLDNGDFLQGSPLGDHLARRGTGRNHPMIASMNAMGYDAATLGNHEFSHGLPFLLGALSGARFLLVTANLTRRDGGDFPARSAILRRRLVDSNGDPRDLRIGLTGVAPRATPLWEAMRLDGAILATDGPTAAAAEVMALKAAGADLVVVLCHSGIIGPDALAPDIAAIPGVDAVIAGHTHDTFPGPRFPLVDGIDPGQGLVLGKPVVMPGAFGSHLGLIDFWLDHDGRGWRILQRACHLRRASGARAIPVSSNDLVSPARPAHRRTLSALRRIVGQSSVRLHSHFDLVADSTALRLVAQAQAQHIKDRLSGTDLAALPLLSAVAPFRAGAQDRAGPAADLPPGPIRIRHLTELYQHPNTLVALRLTGDDLADWLERGAAIFRCIAPGSRDAPLIDPDFPGFNFETIDGLTWQVDLSCPPCFDRAGNPMPERQRRIQDLRLAGQPLAPSIEVVLVTNSYRAGGANGFVPPRDGLIALKDDMPVQDVLRRHLGRSGTVNDPGPPRWRFRPMPGTTALFSAGAGARDLCQSRESGAPLPRIEDAGPGPDGLHRFRLHL